MDRRLPIVALLLVGCPNESTGESGSESAGSTGPAPVCEPGAILCDGEGASKTCNAEGSEYSAPTPCGNTDACMDGVGCTDACELAAAQGLSTGCSFRAHNPITYYDDANALAVVNSSGSATATVTLYFGDAVAAGPVSLAPYTGHTFELVEPADLPVGSILRPATTYRVESDVPIAAFLHAPLNSSGSSGSSMLLPDHAKGTRFIVASYTPFAADMPAYFNVLAIEDGTEVTWTPPVPTLAGTGVPAVAAGASASVTLDKGGLLQVSSGIEDISGTLVSTTKPVSVIGAALCVQIPVDLAGCDAIQEDLFPVSAWGSLYAAPHAPVRYDELFRWRVYAGADGVTVDVDPPQAGFPRMMDEGEYYEIATLDHLIFSGDGPFMPVQYTQTETVGLGDPAAYQMIPVERYARRYVFMTAEDFQARFAQVVRKAGAAEVYVDGVKVRDYVDFGDYQVAFTEVSQGAHRAESDDPFGLWYVAYHGKTGIAFPAGALLGELDP